MSKTKKIILVVLVIAILALVGYGAYFAYSIYHFSSSISTKVDMGNDQQPVPVTELKQPETKSDHINILVVGVDSGKFKNDTVRSDVGRTDTIMMFSINQKTNKVSLLSVPRDTYVDIPGRGMDKVNHAHAFGGINLSIKALSQFLGVPINHYVKIDYEAFTKIVDGLGGVTVNVTDDVKFFGDGKVYVQKGLQKMDGATAFNYVQVREGDIGRIQHQQTFVKALADQATSLGSLAKVPGILNNIAGDIQTDLTPKEMLDLVNTVRTMNPGSMKNDIVPGKAGMLKGVSYWFPNEEGKNKLVDTLLR